MLFVWIDVFDESNNHMLLFFETMFPIRSIVLILFKQLSAGPVKQKREGSCAGLLAAGWLLPIVRRKHLLHRWMDQKLKLNLYLVRGPGRFRTYENFT